MSEDWLVRTLDNWISGPFSKEKIQEMILDGQLNSEDEICLSGSYWVHLYQEEELKSQFGFSLPVLKNVCEDTGELTLQEENEQKKKQLTNQTIFILAIISVMLLVYELFFRSFLK